MKNLEKIKRNHSMIFVLIIVSIFMATSCVQRGFTLQRFKITDKQLDSIIVGIRDSSNILKKNYDHDIILMILDKQGPYPIVEFTSERSTNVVERYIFSENRRIIGYIDKYDVPIIILSSIDNKYDFESLFYKFIHPTKDKKCFDYIYFPDDQYCLDKDGTPYPPSFFDGYFYVYRFKAGRFEFVDWSKENAYSRDSTVIQTE